MIPTALIHDPETGNWLAYSYPQRIITAATVAEIIPSLQAVETAVEQQGLHAVGFVSYEASPAFEPSAIVASHGDFPLLWFALCPEPAIIKLPAPETSLPPLNWLPECASGRYASDIGSIRAAIAAGETYQVNHTFFLNTPFSGEPWPFFLTLAQGAHGGYGAWIDTGRHAICSVSPELFFVRDCDQLICRPMKGTATRGTTLTNDLLRAEALATSTKERAENIMILDMIRNDLGRLPGGPVVTEQICAVEKYPTVWQMTSTVTINSSASLEQIFTALFPCASVTGAPKLQTMQHIARLEGRPRNLYTGAIGRLAPGRQALFSVAIRTAVIDRQTQRAEYGIGAGITWDSEPTAEYAECLAKAKVLSTAPVTFDLLESLLFEPGSGIFLRDAHLRRMQESATYFDFPIDAELIRARLAQTAATLPAQNHKLRLLLNRAGEVTISAEAITKFDSPLGPLRLHLATSPVDSNDPFLYHKTTNRAIYDAARQSGGDADEVLLFNERGEITEACNFNLVAEIDGEKLTPALSCGLLPGTFRGELLARGEIKEGIITLADLKRSQRLFLVNSVRRWREAVLIE